MKASFEYQRGNKPLLISMPHNSSEIPPEVALKMTTYAQKSKDSDWFLDRLYDFAHDLGVHSIKPKWSRNYIDLNRNPSGEALYPGSSNTELCPLTDFDEQPIYLPGQQPEQNEIEQRINLAWKPYHHCIEMLIAAMVAEHGYAILFDAHSIRSKVPRFFDAQLPDFNFGNAAGKSCDNSLLTKLEELNYQPWSQVSNGRFKGGYITRNYGDPANNVHALQLELSQATYMDEERLEWHPIKADKVKIQLQAIIQSLLDWKP